MSFIIRIKTFEIQKMQVGTFCLKPAANKILIYFIYKKKLFELR